MIRVIFNYQEESRLWETVVEGARSELEACQVFSAVVLTCQQLDPDLLGRTIVVANSKKGHVIVPCERH